METKICKCCGKEKPIDAFWKNKNGYTEVCRECVLSKRGRTLFGKTEVVELKEQLNEARSLRLSDFAPRELMVELKRRGYEFIMKYTEVHIINSDSL